MHLSEPRQAKSDTHVAFIQEPEGVRIELIERMTG
jgi:hypothetical protein